MLAFTSGRRMMAANVALLLASIGFVYAVKTTSPANAAFLGGTICCSASSSPRFLGERIVRRTYLAIPIAPSDWAIMVAGDVNFHGAGKDIVG